MNESPVLWSVRYVLPGVLVFAGIVLLALNPGGVGVEGFAMAAGAGLSVLLINFLYRLGVSGDEERQREEEARRYFDVHGEWPEEEERPRGRKWTLPAGVHMDDEQHRH